jgi:peptidoglycan/LPS O-acetylase OafA/YrhL
MPADLKPLTTLRFFAALWVVAFDWWTLLTGAPAPALAARGYLGVELFFVLSGFILTHVYLDQVGTGRFDWRGFLWARLARIYPMHLLTLAGVGAMAAAAALFGRSLEHDPADLSVLVQNLLLVHAWGTAPAAAWNHPSWSISAEWFAYLAFPAVGWAAWRLRDRPQVALASAATVIAVLYPLFERVAGFPLAQATIAWGALRIVPCFLLGAAVNLLWRSGALRTRLQAEALALLALAVVFKAALAGWPDPVFVLAFGALILGLAGLSSTGSTLFTGQAGVWLGEVSYAIYMVLVPWTLLVTGASRVFAGGGDGELPWPARLVLVTGLLPVAALAHHLVERPARAAMRRWWTGRRFARAAA